MSSAFGSSEGAGSAALVSAATVLDFLAACGLPCVSGITRNMLDANSNVHQKHFFRLVIKIQTSGPLWDHAALEHFVRDWRCDLVDECLSHLWVALQCLNGVLFHRVLGSLAFLCSLLPQLFAGGLLIFLDNLLGDPVHDWMILSAYGDAKQSDR